MLKLSAGTLTAQSLTVVIAPILTRYFSPDQFGLLSLYAGIVAILCVIIAGRYELTIVLPEKDEDAREILLSSFLISFVLSLLILALVVIFHTQIVDVLGNENISNWLYLIPVSTLLIGVANSLNYWYVRREKYMGLSRSVVAQSISTNGANIALGAMAVNGGLVLGQLVGSFVNALWLLGMYVKKLPNDLMIQPRRIMYWLNHYKDFPIKSGISGVLNILSNQLPVILISVFYGPVILGYYALLLRVLNMPITMVGRSISQVFMKESNKLKDDPKSLYRLVRKTTLILLMICLPAIIPFYFYGERIFEFVFGEEWRVSGELLKYFLLFYTARFIYYSQSTLFTVKRKLGMEARLNFMLFISQIGAVLAGYFLLDGFAEMFILMSQLGMLVYAFFIYHLFRIAKMTDV